MKPKHRERGHSEAGSGSAGKALRSSGSPRHTEMVGPGPIAGAGEYEARGPGKTGRGLAPDMYPSEKTPSGKQKVSDRTRGQEEEA